MSFSWNCFVFPDGALFSTWIKQGPGLIPLVLYCRNAMISMAMCIKMKMMMMMYLDRRVYMSGVAWCVDRVHRTLCLVLASAFITGLQLTTVVTVTNWLVRG